MPITWSISEEEALALVRYEGPTTLAEVVDTMVEVAGSPEFQPHYGVLVDLREMEYSPSIRELIEIASALINMKSLMQGKIALVTSTAFHYQMTQFNVRLVSVVGVRAKAFREMEEARKWVLSSES
jgi:hypothetical protein